MLLFFIVFSPNIGQSFFGTFPDRFVFLRIKYRYYNIPHPPQNEQGFPFFIYFTDLQIVFYKRTVFLFYQYQKHFPINYRTSFPSKYTFLIFVLWIVLRASPSKSRKSVSRITKSAFFPTFTEPHFSPIPSWRAPSIVRH